MDKPLHPASDPTPQSTDKPAPVADVRRMPGAIDNVYIGFEGPNARALTRLGLIEQKRECEIARADASSSLRRRNIPGSEKSELYGRLQACRDEEIRLEELLQTRLLPQHGPSQFIGPRAFLRSSLFRVAGKQCVRADSTSLVLVQHPHVVYRGPELRQSDGLVFIALLHIARDVLMGTPVSFLPESVCRTVFGRYDGNSRRQLLEHIQRLQSGVVVFERFSVQLCLRFDYPSRGRWTVALDPDLLALFEDHAHVWLDVETRTQLPAGLATWLYGYIRSQTRLIPTRLDVLREASGSDASPKAFMNGMRLALKELVNRGVIESGWILGDGTIRWMKGRRG